ncbi:MAG: M23 family metallopeptidase [Marinilabiliaceae bacterium]|nr:M23 family metallopeptidase [Marinilabiliaceae bacterium]
MDTNNAKKRFSFKRLKNKFRLVIINESSYEEAFSVRLSLLNVLTVSGAFFLIIVILVTYLIAFTDLREFIPGYPDANQRLLIVRNAQRIDSLASIINRRDMFMSNIQMVLRGEVPSLNDTIIEQVSSAPPQQITFERSEHDSIFRKQVENEEKFNFSAFFPPKSLETLETDFFFAPLKGIISNSFGTFQGHYGVDILATSGERVSAILDGVVTFSGWTVETGYVIQIQHNDNLLSIYKHNERLLKQVGETVKAGDPIAKVGNSGELTTGPHLHFELWHDGTPLNPQDYINF